MKRVVMILMVLSLSLFGLNAETERGNSFSLGAGLVDAAGDFGFQGTLTSPWFFNDHMAVRAGCFMVYNAADYWTPCYGAKLGLIGGSFMATADIRLYGEGGAIFFFPSTNWNNDTFAFGGYGHFGLEFFVDRSNSGLAYYVELGSNGIGATAIKRANSPHYMTGFETTVGLRFV